jgi:hypothetical protein
MKYLRLCCASFVICVCASPIFSQSTPRAAVEAFYRYDRSHSQTFDRANIDARRRWFSPELYRLFLNELKRQAAFLKKNPTDKPYFGDGLPFQPWDEVCDGDKGIRRTVMVRQEFRRATRAAATATFAYPKPCANSDPVVYTIGLVRVKDGWVIDDINYGEDTTLKQRLRRKTY